MRDIVLYLSVKYNGDWDKIMDALDRRERVTATEIEKIKEKYKGKYITIFDMEYPNPLKRLAKPPFTIFYKGDLSKLENNIIWPISALELETKEIVDIEKKLQKNKITTILGYSSVLEKDLLEVINKNVIVVKDGGIDNNLIITKELEDKILKNGGLIISEYPGYVIPTKEQWNRSNILKSSFTNSLVLLTSIKDRTIHELITITIQNGKDVYCLYDNSIDSNNYNNTLIDMGAYALNDIGELKY